MVFCYKFCQSVSKNFFECAEDCVGVYAGDGLHGSSEDNRSSWEKLKRQESVNGFNLVWQTHTPDRERKGEQKNVEKTLRLWGPFTEISTGSWWENDLTSNSRDYFPQDPTRDRTLLVIGWQKKTCPWMMPTLRRVSLIAGNQKIRKDQNNNKNFPSLKIPPLWPSV